MSKILDQKSVGYSFALHIMHKLQPYLGELALQGGMGIALAIDASRQTRDIDMSVSPEALAKLERHLPGLVRQLFLGQFHLWTQCRRRDSDFYLHWGGRDRSRRLRVSWWADDHATEKEHVEFQFYAVHEEVLLQYPPQVIKAHDPHTGMTLQFLMRASYPISALADKIVAIANSPRVRLIDYVDALRLLNTPDLHLSDVARAIDVIMTAYTDESADVMLRRCLRSRPAIDEIELQRQLEAIQDRVPSQDLMAIAGTVDRFNETRTRIVSNAIAIFAGAGYIQSGSISPKKASKPASSSLRL